MKCPDCVKAGELSEVTVGLTWSTLIGWSPYYDADGKYHTHDPNTHRTSYSCSRGHGWSVRARTPCPACGADWTLAIGRPSIAATSVEEAPDA